MNHIWINLWVSFLSTGIRTFASGSSWVCISGKIIDLFRKWSMWSLPYPCYVILQGIGFIYGKTWLRHHAEKPIIFRDMRTQGEHDAKASFWISCLSAEKTDSQIDELNNWTFEILDEKSTAKNSLHSRLHRLNQ